MIDFSDKVKREYWRKVDSGEMKQVKMGVPLTSYVNYHYGTGAFLSDIRARRYKDQIKGVPSEKAS